MSETKKSTHRAEIVPVVLEKHPDADTLSIIRHYDQLAVFYYRVSDKVFIRDYPKAKP